MNKPVTCIALDFDKTIAHFSGEYEGLYDIFCERGIPREKVKEAYTKIRKTENGFTFSGMYELLKENLNASQAELHADFEKWLRDSLLIYPEVSKMIEIWRKKVPVVIVTGGQANYQKQKIDSVKISYDGYYRTALGEKAPVFKTLLEKYGAPILFIDDKIEELDALCKNGILKNEVRMILIDRKNTHPEQGSYETISSFEDPKLSPILGF